MGHIEDLFAQVYERPDDDELRLVLADALAAQGDPRGDLIHFQYRPAEDHGYGAMRLLQQHGLRWLGALQGAVVPLAYERGFLAGALVLDAEAAIGCPEWSTVHTVELESAASAFLFHPVMKSIRRVMGAEPPVIRRMLEDPRLAARLDALGLADAESLPEVIALLDRFPRLARVELPHWTRLDLGDDGGLSKLTAMHHGGLADSLARLPITALRFLAVHSIPPAELPAYQAAAARQTRLAHVALDVIEPDDD